MIATYNRRAMLGRSLCSVRNQIYKDFEVIVVDDGSTEEIDSVVRDVCPSAKFIRRPNNGGIPVARNAALEHASGEIAAFLDSDDLWHPNYLFYHHNAYLGARNAIFAFTNYYSNGPIRSGPVKQLVEEPRAPNALLHMIMRPFVHTMSCFTAPLRDVKAIGGFSIELKRFSDLDLYIRLLAGTGRRKQLSCLYNPVLGLPHIAVMKNIHVIDRSLEDYTRDWSVNKSAFLDRVFNYSFMQPFQELRDACDLMLQDGQEAFFKNFSSAA